MYREATELLEDILSNSQVIPIEGQSHIGLATAPKQFLPELFRFTDESN